MVSDNLARRWQRLGAPEPPALVDAWRQLHWAAQVPAALADACVEARADDSHLSLGWDEAAEALVTRSVGAVRAGLRLADLTLVLLEGASAVAEYALAGRRLEEGLAWMQDAASRRLETPPGTPLVRRDWDMPEHPVGEGERFEAAPSAAFEEIGRWYANADLVLGELTAATPGASDVRCWPHHFDIATLVSLDRDRDSREAATIGIGLAPADASLGEPYVYANPWPAPEDAELPALEAGGEWYRDAWFGAVLRASQLLAGTGQRERLEAFLRSALAANQRLLGEGA